VLLGGLRRSLLVKSLNVDTPEWEGYATASPEEQQAWDSYNNALKDHEEGHVEIAVKGAT
jgi:predicted secreted Zn-dependent protease